MKELELRIQAFINNPKVKVRSGIQHNVTGFQRDGNGNVVLLVGTVTEKRSIGTEGTKDEVILMYWHPSGVAQWSQPGIYDLVEDCPIEDLGK